MGTMRTWIHRTTLPQAIPQFLPPKYSIAWITELAPLVAAFITCDIWRLLKPGVSSEALSLCYPPLLPSKQPV